MNLYAKKHYRELIKLAKENHIKLDHNCPKSIVAMTVRFDDGFRVICLPLEDIDPDGLRIGPTILECFAHEMGHCMTDGFYAPYTPIEGRMDAELKACEWAIKFLMPLPDILSFISTDKMIRRMLAIHFNVSEDFVEEACNYYCALTEKWRKRKAPRNRETLTESQKKLRMILLNLYPA